MSKKKTHFSTTHVTYPEPHPARTRAILKAHPEIKKLFGRNPTTAIWAFLIVSFQVAMAVGLSHSSILLIFFLAYFVGAFANHAMFVIIHECTHNLVFKGNTANSLLQIFANFPIIFPSAMSFRLYHMIHHRYQGDINRDSDLPRPFEVEWVGNSTFRKILWFTFFFVSQLLRLPHLKGISFMSPWVALNMVVQFSFLGLLIFFAGWKAFLYLAIATIFSVGLHPVGGRWVQEHYISKAGQETYSYYGPLNKIAFNVGYHNEHHDFMSVPWTNLKKVRAIAPEFYDTLHFHKSWSGLLRTFLTSPKMGLFSRVTRD